jgi:hypothetical protein
MKGHLPGDQLARQAASPTPHSHSRDSGLDRAELEAAHEPARGEVPITSGEPTLQILPAPEVSGRASLLREAV